MLLVCVVKPDQFRRLHFRHGALVILLLLGLFVDRLFEQLVVERARVLGLFVLRVQ